MRKCILSNRIFLFQLDCLKSDDLFFDAVIDKTFLVLYKIGDYGTDSWLELIDSKLVYYYGFFNNNNDIISFKRIF